MTRKVTLVPLAGFGITVMRGNCPSAFLFAPGEFLAEMVDLGLGTMVGVNVGRTVGVDVSVGVGGKTGLETSS